MSLALGTQVSARYVARWLVPAISSCLLACGGMASEHHADLSMPADSSPATAPPGMIITWGHTGIVYEEHPGNLRLLHNVLSDLMTGVPAARAGRLLYTMDCDPRQDPMYCNLAGSFDQLSGFFATAADFGELEFRLASSVNLSDYAAVIFETCLYWPPSEEARGRGGDQQLDAYLEQGGRALILGDNFCFTDGRSSAQSANALLRGWGLNFTAEDPGSRPPEIYDLPSELRVGLLGGVESLDIFRVTPQQIEHSFVPVVQAWSGVLMARRHAD
jgi:hypothetical protein